jgi:hypothetical protein
VFLTAKTLYHNHILSTNVFWAVHIAHLHVNQY